MQIAFTTQINGITTNYCTIVGISCTYPELPLVTVAYFVNKSDAFSGVAPAATSVFPLNISVVDLSQRMPQIAVMLLLYGPLAGGTLVEN